ncbi:methionine biosynthesis protein MetW [Chitinophaga nivalis]|uniref:Methyltransferase domain-containing protein n=1 Tax=Chitinophaga nivalis TaxID=2991709 RepID=A0ABT3INN9_9BACT|nr:methionine biosynthesis protein MetW [Chitinophaga nivalis]MCW3464707.1 methyltransferase domain-containing protein [Chitinophaga nivalis]MCW3485602.1 methyltransferase domain-containing protein [Chitinophaga nivalis]
MTRNDNRNYNYEDYPSERRGEYEAVLDLLSPGSKVVDLACGNGALMELMINEKQCTCIGMELSPSGVATCLQKGLQVTEGRIDEKLPYADNAFDVAVCNVTIQMVLYPETLLAEMKRISRRQIISFPNFAYFRNRLDMLLYGRMPKPMLFGYQWYNTGHIHQLSLRDFNELLQQTGGLQLTRSRYVPVGFKIIDGLGNIFPGWFRKIVIQETEKI